MTVTSLQTALKRLSTDRSYAGYNAVSSAIDQLSPNDSGLEPVRMAIVRNFTVDPLVPIIKGDLVEIGFHPNIHLGDFDSIAPEALDPNSSIYKFDPHFIIVAQWLETISPLLTNRFISASSEEISVEIDRLTGLFDTTLQAFRSRTDAPILINNFPMTSTPTLGILDSQRVDSHHSAINALNGEIQKLAAQSLDIYVVDYAQIFYRIGSERAFDERYWHIGRAPISRHALLPVGREYGKFIRALRGKVRKCLVLDLDNTLWGGIIGEDGLNGIKLGPDYPGSAFMAFQQEILNLHARGIILTICSKNNEADALEVIREHPHMVLREKNFAAMEINWDDKATNIRRIAEGLNIGLDSIVFVDDSPFECDFVRDQLPEVTVLNLPQDASQYKRALAEGAYFDALAYSLEDKNRNTMYRAQVKRQALKDSASSLETYLHGLELEVVIAEADGSSIPRIAQLTQKTNQFNFTTRRYGEGAIQKFADDDSVDVLHIRLKDKVSDMGIIGIAIVFHSGKHSNIDTFLLSCRAIGRGAEDALLAQILKRAKDRGIEKITGRYLPTQKNGQVEGYYQSHGFGELSTTDEGTLWEFKLDQATAAQLSPPAWLKVTIGVKD